MESINIRDRETSSDMEGERLYLLEAQSKLDIRELETRKVQYNLDDTVMYLCISHQEGRQGDMERPGIGGHGAEGRMDSLLGGWRDISQILKAAERYMDDARDRAKSIIGRLKRTRGQ